MNTAVSTDTVRIFDTTLRDGEQSPGCSMSPQQKVVMARALAELAGKPVSMMSTPSSASSESDRQAMALIGREVRTPTLAVLSRCLAGDIEISARALEAAANPRLHVFLSTSPLHREHKLRMSKEQVLESVHRHVTLARGYVDDVEFSAEDATRTEIDYLIEVARTAIAAGARTINLPDTVGFTTPEEIGDMFRRVIAGAADINGADKVIFSAHCHNDLGLAVANSLAAAEAGARQIEGSINGIGERAGNCAIEEIAMALKVRNAFYGLDTGIQTPRIVPTSQLLQRLIGMPVQRNKAVVGTNAFAHESGIHQHGMLRHRGTYEIMRPQDVGWPDTQMVLGRHSGRAAVDARLRALGYLLEEDELKLVFEQFKGLCERQRVVGDADLQMLMQDAAVSDGYRLASMTISDVGGRANALVELSDPEGNRVAETAQGNGPVDALFGALSAATGVKLELDSYQVHSVGIGADARGEASLSVRADGLEYEGTGTSKDIIEASALAWLDVANRLLRQRQHAPAPSEAAAA